MSQLRVSKSQNNESKGELVSVSESQNFKSLSLRISESQNLRVSKVSES